MKCRRGVETDYQCQKDAVSTCGTGSCGLFCEEHSPKAGEKSRSGADRVLNEVMGALRTALGIEDGVDFDPVSAVKQLSFQGPKNVSLEALDAWREDFSYRHAMSEAATVELAEKLDDLIKSGTGPAPEAPPGPKKFA